MIKNLLDQLNYSICAEIALAIFAIVFIAVSIRVLLTRKDIAHRQARIVLDDSQEHRG